MNTPLISVIIPTFNRPDLLQRAIRSVQQQSYPQVEIVVVNDAGSPVEALLHDWDAGRNQILSIRSAKNLGRGGVRNLGLKLAHGQYIAYLDDDDYYYPEHLATLYQFLQQQSAQVVYTDSLNAIQEMRSGQWYTLQTQLLYSSDFDADRMLVENYIPTLCILHERSCLDTTGLFDESLRSHEDWDMWIRLTHHFAPIHLAQVTSEFTTRTNFQSGQSTTDVNADFLETQGYIYAKYATWVENRPDIRKKQEEVAHNLQVAYDYQRSHLVVDFMNTIMGFADKGEFARALEYYQNNPQCHNIKGYEPELERIQTMMQKVEQLLARKGA